MSGKRDGKSAKDSGYSLRDWFKGGGWVQTGGKYDGKPCAKQPGQKTKPYCRDPDDRAALDKDERNKRAAKKRKEDPNPNRSGKANMVTQEAAGEKDSCYKKVKSRYKVWPSAYASGALSKCRKVGADNWGNKTEAKDETEIGITGLPIPKKKRTPAKQYEFEKQRRTNLGPNVRGIPMRSDVNPNTNPRQRTFEEFMMIAEEIKEAYVDYTKGKLSTGKSPQQTLAGRHERVKATAARERGAASSTDSLMTPATKRSQKLGQARREMDANTSTAGKVRKALHLGRRDNAGPSVQRGEPNTARHQQAIDARAKSKR